MGKKFRSAEYKYEFANTITLRDLQEEGLQVSIDFTMLVKIGLADALSKLDAQPDSSPELTYGDTVKSIRARGIPISQSFNVDELLEKYKVK